MYPAAVYLYLGHKQAYGCLAIAFRSLKQLIVGFKRGIVVAGNLQRLLKSERMWLLTIAP
jgi:hypothetical protein